MSQVTEQSVRFQTALASIKLIQASAVLDLTEDDFDFLTSNKVWIATDRSRARRCVEACVYGTVNLSTNLASHFFDLVIGKILTSRLSLSKHLAHNLGNLLLLGKIGVFHNRRNASSRLLLLISKHLILCIYL